MGRCILKHIAEVALEPHEWKHVETCGNSLTSKFWFCHRLNQNMCYWQKRLHSLVQNMTTKQPKFNEYVRTSTYCVVSSRFCMDMHCLHLRCRICETPNDSKEMVLLHATKVLLCKLLFKPQKTNKNMLMVCRPSFRELLQVLDGTRS